MGFIIGSFVKCTVLTLLTKPNGAFIEDKVEFTCQVILYDSQAMSGPHYILDCSSDRLNAFLDMPFKVKRIVYHEWEDTCVGGVR